MRFCYGAPMRILLTSDLHYSLKQYDWLIKAAPHFDVLVIAGDHIDAMSPVPAAVQMAALSASFGALAGKTRLLVCSGNHDLNAWTAEGEKTAAWLSSISDAAIAVDGDTLEVGDTLFTVCPWWDGPHARARLEQMLESASGRRRGRWVWIYHAPPEGLLSWTGKRHYGDAFLAGLVERHAPDVVMCGHIHEAPFRNGGSWIERRGATWLFNAGRQIGDVPARIEIDFANHAAQWFSLAGTEQRSLQ
ncbi:MAG TPA: metallophosphoesterase [Casimicrobiaceae bacterium]|nr:metallophosphoesterase [Casimicrobiaceae bacterium]